MAASDRLYEVACECRDTEERMERVLRDNRNLRDAAGELLDAIDNQSPAGAASERLRTLLNRP